MVGVSLSPCSSVLNLKTSRCDRGECRSLNSLSSSIVPAVTVNESARISVTVNVVETPPDIWFEGGIETGRGCRADMAAEDGRQSVIGVNSTWSGCLEWL